VLCGGGGRKLKERAGGGHVAPKMWIPSIRALYHSGMCKTCGGV
jgi:hypothetical protein